MDVVADRPWGIERLVMETGVAESSGILFERGVLHASGSTRLGNNRFHRVDEQSLQLLAAYRSVFSGPVTEGSVKGQNIRRVSLRARNWMLMKVEQSYGTGKMVDPSGAPGSSTVLRQWQLRGSEIFARLSEGGCEAAAMLNALRDVQGHGVAKRVPVQMGETFHMTFGKAGYEL